MFEYEAGLSTRLGDLGIGAIFASGVLMFAASVVLFFVSERAKWLAAALYVLGAAPIWVAGLMALDQETVLHIPSGIEGFPSTIAVEPRHEDATRYLIYIGLVLFPIFAARGF